MKKKKICHVLYSGLGGHGNVFFSLVEADKNQEFEYSAIFYGIEPVKNEYKKKCSEYKIPYKFCKKKKGVDTRFFSYIYKTLKELNPDIIFLHSGLLILPAKIFSVFFHSKIILRETQANHLKTFSNWLFLFLSGILANHVVFLTGNFKKEVGSRSFLFKKLFRNSKVIPNGLNLKKFNRIPRDYDTQEIKIGMQSRLVQIKDYETLLIAFDLVCKQYSKTSLRLQIAGNGEDKNRLIAIKQSLSCSHRIDFLGHLNEYELIDIMCDWDIYVHATFGETMSTSIMQAMSLGLPIIASDVKGVNNMIVNGENGLLVPVKHSKLLAENIIYLIQNQRKREKLSSASKSFAKEHFNMERMFYSYKELFKN